MKPFIRRTAALLCTSLLIVSLPSGCHKTGGSSLTSNTSGTIDCIYHNPYGLESLYGSKEVTSNISYNGKVVSSDLCEREPNDPVEGDDVILHAAAWPYNYRQEMWVEWTLNGKKQKPVQASISTTADDIAYWSAHLGSFKQGDRITYTIKTGEDVKTEASSETYAFTVYNWVSVKAVKNIKTHQNGVELVCSTNTELTPSIEMTFPRSDSLRLSVDPEGKTSMPSGISGFTVADSGNTITVTTASICVLIQKSPYYLRVTDKSGKLLMREYSDQGSNLRLLTDGKTNVKRHQENLYSRAGDGFYGFGMKYDALDHRGSDVDIYCVDWYTEQNNKTYEPVPFYLTNTYGFYADSTYYAQFRLATEVADKCTVNVNAGDTVNKSLDTYYFFGKTNEDRSSAFALVIGKRELPPVWTFGPWLSANEWNKQSDVEEQIRETEETNIPTSAIVIEAWSDEKTFYIWNDATYTAQSGSYVPKLSDFTFSGKWPDPLSMIQNAHNNGIKIVLWQIPVLKSEDGGLAQAVNDKVYAVSKHYVLSDGSGGAYRRPAGWFGGSMLIDFTSKAASDWFLNKRLYLLKDMGIDGFKCDGGEFIWGRTVTASDGRKGDELRNAYSDLYCSSYEEFLKKVNGSGVVFHRSGGAHSVSITWAGDQKSSFLEFQSMMLATLNASLSGNPFVAYDIAGFSGSLPTPELYKRSVAQAAFSPVMQVHSEQSGDPNPSYARTPWNMAEQTGDQECLTVYRKFADIRMNLLPYVYSEAAKASDTGVPLMRSMVYAYPDDAVAKTYPYQYMFGENLLVCPVVWDGVEKLKLYLPAGNWVGLFDNKTYAGGREYTVDAPTGTLPVFVRAGAVLPMNLSDDYTLGGSVGNKTDRYEHLAFRVYPGADSSYIWTDYTHNNARHTITVSSGAKECRISTEGVTQPVTLQISGNLPASVTVGDLKLSRAASLAALKNGTFGWYYSEKDKMTTVKLPTNTGNTLLKW